MKPDLAKYREAVLCAAEAFRLLAIDIELGTKPLNDLLAPTKNLIAVAQSAEREIEQGRAA